MSCDICDCIIKMMSKLSRKCSICGKPASPARFIACDRELIDEKKFCAEGDPYKFYFCEEHEFFFEDEIFHRTFFKEKG